MPSINSLAMSESSAFYYSREVRTLLESHVQFLIRHPDTSIFQITPNLAYKYEGDLYGLLATLKVPMHYHWIIMRMNGFTSPTEMPENKIAFLQPSFAVVEQIINIHRTARSIVR